MSEPRLVTAFSDPLESARGSKPDLAEGAVAEAPDRLTGKVSLYIALLVIVAGLCVAFFATELPVAGWQGLATLIVAAIAFERFGIKIYGDTQVSAGVVALCAIAVS